MKNLRGRINGKFTEELKDERQFREVYVDTDFFLVFTEENDWLKEKLGGY